MILLYTGLAPTTRAFGNFTPSRSGTAFLIKGFTQLTHSAVGILTA